METVTARAPQRPVSGLDAPPPRRSQKGPIFWVILVLGFVFALLGGIKVLQIATMIKAGGKMVPPPTTITSAVVKEANWQPSLRAVGSISPVQGATISAELAGRVDEINFDSGGRVEKRQPLIKLDVAAEEAQLRSAKADAALAKAELDRSTNLSKGSVISQSEFDTSQAKFDAAQAAVDNMQAIINKKAIRAPFAGIAGIRYVNPGQMVAVGDKLVTLQTLDQVFVDFSLPQDDISKIVVGQKVSVTTDAIPGREFSGTLTAINSAIDTATRSVQLQATLENKDNSLRAGMFARVQLLLPQKNSTLYIPATAVAYAPFGDSIYILEKKRNEKTKKDELILRQQFVRLGETRGDFVAVTEGVKKGQEIASTGAFKLRNGMNVVVDNALAPKAQLAPAPDDT